MIKRPVRQVLSGIPTSDGAGVRLTRIIGSPELNMLDPFLLFDVFESDRPDDYIGGFPPHPHRGFETVTYMLAGRLEHEDSEGNRGVIETGGVQWMTAGSGIIHSEMPKQESGRLHGIQLWVNLPARLKWSDPAYRQIGAAQIPTEQSGPDVSTKVIAGRTDQGTVGPVRDVATMPILFDIDLTEGAELQQEVPSTHNGFVYVIDGEITIVADAGVDDRVIPARSVATLGNGDHVHLAGASSASRVLLVAARRIDEPVARGGPFVMNTRQEILQAFDDYERGRLTAGGADRVNL